MAKTKAKAKVKPVVKNKSKATASKVKSSKPAPKKAVQKVVAKKNNTAKAVKSKKAQPKPKAPVKKSIPVKGSNKSKPAVKAKIAVKTKPVAKVKPVEKAKSKPVIKGKVQEKAKAKIVAKPAKEQKQVKQPNKPIEKTKKVENISTKKPESATKEVSGKKVKLDFPKKRAGRKPKNKGDEDDGFELLEVPKLDPILKKPAKKKFIIPVSQEVYVNPNAKVVPIPKNIGNYKKFEIEYPIHASPYIIYSFISTPAGLSEWFAENVNIRNDEFTFLWDGSQQTATLLSKKENTFMKFRWNDEPEFTFFEFRIVVDEITQDVAFWVTDFAEDEKSKEASIMLWNSQIEALMHAMGA